MESEAERDALGALGIARRAGATAVGTRAVRQAARAGRLRAVLVARDASPNALDRLSGALSASPVPVVECAGREALGAAVGRSPVAVVGITDGGLAARITASLGSARQPVSGESIGEDERERSQQQRSAAGG